MTKLFETNQRVFRDGSLVLYQRPDHKKPKWQCRIHVPGATGYVIKSTGTTDEFEARRFAEDLYDQIRLRVKAGGTLKTVPFQSAFSDFVESYELNAPSKRRFTEVCTNLERYPLSYFAKTPIDQIGTKEIAEFLDWRKTNGIRHAPSNNTLRHELTYLKIFFNWCQKRGITLQTIDWNKPSSDKNRRPHFSRPDWAKLTRFMREWIKRGDAEGHKRRERLLLCQYALILANTGLRVGEARNLRWKDIEAQERVSNDQRIKDIIFWVRGKTGARDVVARSGTIEEYLSRIHEMRAEELGKAPPEDEYVFCSRKGKPIGNFKKGFEALLAAAEVLTASDGSRRTIYSLRHTYATFRLEEGVSVYILAKNMGTSTKMIEEFYGHTINRANAEELTKHRNRGQGSEMDQPKPWERIVVR